MTTQVIYEYVLLMVLVSSSSASIALNDFHSESFVLPVLLSLFLISHQCKNCRTVPTTLLDMRAK